MPNAAANNTCNVPGNKNVIVCAGYQKNGIVFLKTKPYWMFQLIFSAIVCCMLSGLLKNPANEPPVSAT